MAATRFAIPAVANDEAIIQSALDAGRLGRADEGAASLRRFLQRQPAHMKAIQALGQLLIQGGHHQQAIYEFERSVRAFPKNAPFRNNLGMALWHAGRYKDAVTPFREAVALDPSYAIGWVGLSMALVNVLDIDGAIDAADRAMALNPNLTEPYNNKGLAQILGARLEEGVETLRRGLAIAPQNTQLRDTLLLAMQYRSCSGEDLLREHREFGRLFPPSPILPPARTTPDPERRIRIGYLSADLRNHSVGYFARAMVEHRDRSNTEVFCYYASPVSDAMTEVFKKAADHWVNVAMMPDAQIDARIRADRIDILVELGGHTPGNRLTALINKPAPIVASALGYPNTTGLSTVDYRLVDTHTDPPGAEAWSVETPYRLDPCFLCYHPPAAAPPLSEPRKASPADRPIIFGSFNAFPKVSPETIAAWARILDRVPASRLNIKNTIFGSDKTRERVAGFFAAAGADPSRIDLLPPNDSQADHLRAYGRIDIALDTFPYNGTTTTCEAMWMGVPVVTLAGTLHAGRVGVTLLNAVRLPELVAQTTDEYVEIAAKLATDPARLSGLHQTLRNRISNSVLCDAPAYGRRIDAAYRDMWRKWCAASAKR